MSTFGCCTCECKADSFWPGRGGATGGGLTWGVGGLGLTTCCTCAGAICGGAAVVEVQLAGFMLLAASSVVCSLGSDSLVGVEGAAGEEGCESSADAADCLTACVTLQVRCMATAGSSTASATGAAQGVVEAGGTEAVSALEDAANCLWSDCCAP